MTEKLITFETAKLAKEKGFDWECRFLGRIDLDEKDVEICQPDELRDFINKKYSKNSTNANNEVTFPTQTLLQKWLREMHNIHIQNHYLNELHYCKVKYYRISKNTQGFATFEEALEEGLKIALKLIKI